MISSYAPFRASSLVVSPSIALSHALYQISVRISLVTEICGTGTSARVASLFAKGELGLNQEFVHESVIGTQFTARIVEPATVGPCKGGVPEVSGTAYLTGFHQFVIDPSDTLGKGFRLD